MTMQRTRGPRFFIPRRFRTNAYDYIRKFKDAEDLEAASLSENSTMNDDCIICMHNLRFEVDDSM